jgi:hypothetical protein
VTINIYQLETTVQLQVSFTNIGSGAAVDPGAVTLWLQDPNGSQTSYTYSGGQVVRTGTGQYYCNVTPDLAGRWTYKWQGTTPAEVSSPDSYFIVRASAFAI